MEEWAAFQRMLLAQLLSDRCHRIPWAFRHSNAYKTMLLLGIKTLGMLLWGLSLCSRQFYRVHPRPNAAAQTAVVLFLTSSQPCSVTAIQPLGNAERPPLQHSPAEENFQAEAVHSQIASFQNVLSKAKEGAIYSLVSTPMKVMLVFVVAAVLDLLWQLLVYMSPSTFNICSATDFLQILVRITKLCYLEPFFVWRRHLRAQIRHIAPGSAYGVLATPIVEETCMRLLLPKMLASCVVCWRQNRKNESQIPDRLKERIDFLSGIIFSLGRIDQYLGRLQGLCQMDFTVRGHPAEGALVDVLMLLVNFIVHTPLYNTHGILASIVAKACWNIQVVAIVTGFAKFKEN